MTRTQDAHASQPEGRPSIHHDLIVDKLEIARTIGLVTDYVVSPIEPQRLEARVMVRRSANSTDGPVKDYVADLLKGIVPTPNIVVTTTAFATGGSVPEMVPQGEALIRAQPSCELTECPGLSSAARLALQGTFNSSEIDGTSLALVMASPPLASGVDLTGECVAPCSDKVEATQSAPSPRAAHLHRLAAAGAMLTCVAVILNVGPFAKPAKIAGLAEFGGQPSPAVMANGLVLLPQGNVAPNPPPLARSAEELQVLPEPIRALIQPPPFSVADVQPSVVKASYQKDESDGVDRPDAVPASAAPQPHADQPNAERPAIVGVWAPDTGTCSARDFQEGLLPTVITNEGAWAGETFCLFTNRKETETGWTVVAKCSSPRGRWTSNVRLTVSENRLTWASKRGTQAYSRCAPDVLMAQVR